VVLGTALLVLLLRVLFLVGGGRHRWGRDSPRPSKSARTSSSADLGGGLDRGLAPVPALAPAPIPTPAPAPVPALDEGEELD